ncbi:MAG: RluA family pseudouridine synthase, partial [Phycisphaeraceae bacterium]
MNDIVQPTQAGVRLDRWLADRFKLSRRDVRRVLEAKRVQLNGRPASERDKGRMLAAGDRVTVQPFVRPDHRRAFANPQLPLDVAAAGEGWRIVHKPAGMPVHPLTPGETRTLLNALIAREPTVHGVGEAGLRSGVVHRLDVETSGLVLFALTDPLWQRFRTAFADHRATKRYHAIVHGHFADVGQASARLTVARHHPARVAVVEPAQRPRADTRESRRCMLAWRTLERRKDATLIEVDLDTGFLHQIRVMLAHLGHPVAGDAVYGRPAAPAWPSAPPRLMLHATHLAIDEHITADAP